MTQIQQQGLKLIVLFDEFDSITQNQNFDMEFYAFLRALANRYDVAYVVSSGRRLQELCHTKEIADSPFFNIFSNLSLSSFSREEALTLIREPSKVAGYPLDSVADIILSMAGYFPLFIQIACSAFFEYALDEPVSPHDVSLPEIHELFLEEASDHFEYIWDHSTADQQQVLLQLAKGKHPPKSQQYLMKELQKQGYVLGEGGKQRLFSSLFGEYIRAGAKAYQKTYIPEAIVVIDICKSTPTTARYGASFFTSLYEILQDIVKSVVEEYKLNFMKGRGDGFLLTFATVEDAVSAVMDIRKDIAEYNETVEQRLKIGLRFSINFGETMADSDEDRHGDAVHMAFRVEGLRSDDLKEGTEISKEEFPKMDYVFITENVYRILQDREDLTCKFVGLFELRGLTGIHRVYELKQI